MRKRSDKKRIAAGLLVLVLVFTTVFSGVCNTMTVDAAAAYDNQNLLVNSDFEENTAFSPAGGSHLGNWFYWQKAEKTTEDAQSGSASVKFTGDDSALEQDIDGLIVGQTYVYTVWAKLSKSTSQEHIVGVKNYGGSELKQQVTSTEWEKYEIEFVYTSGTPRVYGYVGTHDGAHMYIDNASVTLKSDIEKVSIENGKLTAKFADSYMGIPAVEDLSANYTAAPGNADAKKLTWTGIDWNAQTKTAVLEFTKIAAIPVEQIVTVNLSYKGATITLNFTVDANGEEVVDAKLSSITAENGKIQAVLDVNPTVIPTKDDFTWEYKIGEGEFKELSVTDYTYNSSSKTATVSFDEMRGTTAQNVTVKVTYADVSKEAQFTTEVSDANIYYVDSTNGNDANDGLSTGTAFASIDKLNAITFLPGDQILFKKGETFVGCFKPQGSGTETAPIKIASYGEGDERPVLQPGEDWTVSHIMSADTTVYNVKVNYVIQFYNVEYWEVSDLELHDPTPQQDNSAEATYCSGITIQGEEIGTLEHFYIDNVIIHGFHGPGTNIGKTSGGITMNVITNPQWNRSEAVPTQINDIRITNCEIYDVGRSGINFLTPWAYRSEGKWEGNYGTGRANYEWLPYENFYLGNNYIHDIDGDGCIVDNCANAVVENNLVTRCVTRLHSSAKMAVGLFNWNSDDTYFQFNEVYDIQIGGTEAYNDGQGIEIDALNDRTWVQYNYVHDNRGGFMMFCTVDDAIRGYDYVVRYNISQNDYAHPRQGIFDVYADCYNGQIYNNTLYLTERALKNDQIFLFATAQSSGENALKMYNNIFYYDGEEPKAANQFGDHYLDWQSNIFYGFTNLPANDNPSAPNLNVDPMLEEPGAGGTGTYKDGTITKVDLSCYELLENSPAINAGVPLDDNDGRDYFGNEVAGIPDIGAYESGSVILKLLSMNADIVVNQEEKTITVTDTAKVTARTLLDGLAYEEGVTVELNRDSMAIEGGIRLEEDDIVMGTYNGEVVSYTVKVLEDEKDAYNVIPAEYTNATAGSEETASSSDYAANVLDGNVGTIWHTAWNGAAPADRYLTLEIKDGNDYVISGYEYTPRTGFSSGAVNGIITGYEIYVSDDNSSWTKVANGTWAQNSEVKTVMFEEPVNAKYVKLLAVTSAGDFASAAEARLIGEKVDTDVPTAPVVLVGKVTDNSVEISWTESEDSNGIAEYVLLKDGKKIAVFDADVSSYEVKGLKEGETYTFVVYAVDSVGKKSEETSVQVTVNGESSETEEVVRLFGKGRYDTAYAVADELKEVLGVEKFEAVVVATGQNFADALAGSYLAVKKDAPILLTNGKEANVEQLHDYIKENVEIGGTVYILGGDAAVPASVEAIEGYTVKRLFGNSRYDTNIAILEETGIEGDELIVATGKTFADSLSASAVKLPILLVKPGSTLNDAQKDIVKNMKDIYIIGGDGAVGAEIASELSNCADVQRVYGQSRYDTSVEVAKTFFSDVDKAVVASGKNFPDGLCGGPLAAALNAPLVLTLDGKTAAAAEYVTSNGIASGYVLGGDGALSNRTVIEIFGISAEKYMSEFWREAIDCGIAWEQLAENENRPVTAAETVQLMENSVKYLGKTEDLMFLKQFSDENEGKPKVFRWQLAELLWCTFVNLTYGHEDYLSFNPVSATAISYEVGGTCGRTTIWECPDFDEIDQCVNVDLCDYAIAAFDRRNGDKLLPLYEDGSFRPKETVTVRNAVETFLRYAHSFEDEAVYVPVTKAGKHTIDSALYSGKTSLPDASNEELPQWRGFNISMNSMLMVQALSGNPDDNFYPAEIEYIRELGGNFAHIYLSWSWFQGPDYTCDSQVNLTRLEYLDQIIACCMENDIHLQLVFNDVPNIDGGENLNLDIWWEKSSEVFTDEAVRDTVTEFWRMLARRYADIPNNYLSFNLMNECDPKNDENYAWAFADAVNAIWEESPGRVVVADVHSDNITGASMAELGCALSFHLYQPNEIAVVTKWVEESKPGFYESLTWPACITAAVIYGPEANWKFPELAGNPMTISGNIGGARLDMSFVDISCGREIISIKADGKVLYEDTPPYEYHPDIDMFKPTENISVMIPEGTESVEISCVEGYAFSMQDLSLTYPNDKVVDFYPEHDGWNGMPYVNVFIDEDYHAEGKEFDFANAKHGLISLNDLLAIGKQYGVDVMVGECGIFEGDMELSFGMTQETTENFLRDEIELFESLGLAWACELYGRYSPLTPAPYLKGIDYEKVEGMPYYANQQMKDFFTEIFN